MSPHPGRRRDARPEHAWAEEIAIGSYDDALNYDDALSYDDELNYDDALDRDDALDHDDALSYDDEPLRTPGSEPPPTVVPAWLVAAAVLLACSALVAAALWWQHRTRVIEVTHRVVPYYPAGPDALGCPTGIRCRVLGDAGQPLAVLARRLFPDATVLSSVAVTTADTGRTVQSTIVLRTPAGLELSALAQCVPGAGPVAARAASLPAVGPAQADFVVPGRPGCSVAVAAQIPRSVPVPLKQLRRLAADPDAQLRP
jgi:hypothetical protein